MLRSDTARLTGTALEMSDLEMSQPRCLTGHALGTGYLGAGYGVSWDPRLVSSYGVGVVNGGELRQEPSRARFSSPPKERLQLKEAIRIESATSFFSAETLQ